MADKVPQSSDVLVKRLRRVAKWLDDGQAGSAFDSEQQRAANRARANTCWQAAAMLQELDAILAAKLADVLNYVADLEPNGNILQRESGAGSTGRGR